MSESPQTATPDTPLPRLRPRAFAYRLLNLLSVMISIALAAFFWGGVILITRSSVPEVVWHLPLLIGGLISLIVGAHTHAYLGGPPQFGAVATLWQLRRHQELRALPELPALPRWKVALCYIVPIVANAALMLWLNSQRLGDPVMSDPESDRQVTISMMESSAQQTGFVRVGCQDFPVTTTENSLCFVALPPPQGGQPLEQALPAWISKNLSWKEYELTEGTARRTHHQVAAPNLHFERATGLVSLQTTLSLPIRRDFSKAPDLGDYRLEALSLTGTPDQDGPEHPTPQAAWLKKQGFRAYFVVTPVKK